MMAITSDHIRALHILALKSVESDSYDSWYRSLCRWYSREFCTPLEQVFDMAEEEILQTYFEDTLWQLRRQPGEDAQERYEDLRKHILASPDELKQGEQEDDEWADEMIREIAKETKQNPNLNEGEQYSISGQDFDFIPEDGDWG